MKLNMNVLQISGNLFFRGSATGLNLLLEDCIDCTHLPPGLLCAAISIFKKRTQFNFVDVYISKCDPCNNDFKGINWCVTFYTPHILFCEPKAALHTISIHQQILKAGTPA